MKIAIRVDSATMIGSGHVMRCLTLAERLRRSGADVIFICRELPGHIMQLIQDKRFVVRVLPIHQYPKTSLVDEFLDALKQDCAKDLEYTCEVLKEYGAYDWVVVDHYALDRKWEQGIRPYTKRIWVIDDLADRHHDCDILLDQNYHVDMEKRYEDLVSSSCKALLGPRYLLLREEFFEAQFSRRSRDGNVRNVLVFFGGSDPTNETLKAIEAIHLLDRPDIHFDIVVGKGNVYRTEIEVLCETLPHVDFHFQVNHMAKLMNEADLAIGAGGSTTWERCFLGLPALIIILADNQRQGIEELASCGPFINLGWYSNIDSKALCEHIEHAIARPDLLRTISVKAVELVGAGDGEYKDELVGQFWME